MTHSGLSGGGAAFLFNTLSPARVFVIQIATLNSLSSLTVFILHQANMSSRQLRKLQKQRELEEAKASSQPEDSEGDIGADDEDDGVERIQKGTGAAKPRVSLFAALGGEGGGGDDDDEDEDEGDAETTKEQEVTPVADQQQAAPTKKSKNKKKKKKKAPATAAEPAVQENDVEDEIDKAIKELKLTTGTNAQHSPSTTGTTSQSRLNALLSINTHHLKAMNEMRNLFGRDIIESAHADEEQEQHRRRRGPQQQQVDLETFLRGPPGAKKLPEVSLRRNVFIQGREHWPRATAGGLTMKALEKAPDGAWTEYAYVHDKDYDAIQAVFFAYVGMGDPMRIVYLLQQVRKFGTHHTHSPFDPIPYPRMMSNKLF